jgi:hypothetical protein
VAEDDEGPVGLARWLRLLGIVGLTAVIYFIVPVKYDANADLARRTVGASVLSVALIWGMLYQIRLHVDDSSRRLDGLIVSIVLVVEVFALTFYIVEVRNPGEFAGLDTRIDSLYFTVATLATVGFGDVHAVGQAARALVLVQMVFNVLFVATAAAIMSTRVRDVVRQRSETKRSQQQDPD